MLIGAGEFRVLASYCEGVHDHVPDERTDLVVD